MVDPRYDYIERCGALLLEKYAAHGAKKVRWVAGLPEIAGAHEWLSVETDAQRNALEADPSVAESVKQILADQGFSQEDVARSGVRVQSQETIDRDYDSSWFYAMR